MPKEPGLEMDFSLEAERADRSGVVNEPIFQTLVLGNWTGDGARGDLTDRRLIEIDRDNFDDVINGLGVKLNLETAGGSVELEFRSLDDFHPDELFKSVPLFSDLRDLRKRLRNPDTFNSAAREVREWSATPEQKPAVPVDVPAESDNLLDAILAKPEGGASAPKAAVSADMARLVNDLVRPHLITVDENEQSAMVAAVDDATSELMRSILHDRRFQELESAWRGLFLFVRRTETASDLRIYILNVTKEELADDVKGEAVVAKRIAAGRNGDPFAAVFGNFAFRPDVDDTAALMRIAKLASAISVPFVSHIRPDVIGVTSLVDSPDSDDWDLSGSSNEGKLWNALRDLPESGYLGLTLPRFLARLPYGSDTEPAEAFSFEEFAGVPVHDNYLWANGCFAVAQLLAASYAEFGWNSGERLVQDIDGLPLYMFKQNGESIYQSCAEVQLGQNSAEKLAEHGIMPLVSFKNMDRIRLFRLRSVSSREPRLKGPWK